MVLRTLCAEHEQRHEVLARRVELFLLKTRLSIGFFLGSASESVVKKSANLPLKLRRQIRWPKPIES